MDDDLEQWWTNGGERKDDEETHKVKVVQQLFFYRRVLHCWTFGVLQDKMKANLASLASDHMTVVHSNIQVK